MKSFCRCCILLAMLLAVQLQVNAQRVTISPTSGNIIALESTSDELQANGFGGMFIHHQLPLTMLVGDKDGLSSNGLLSVPANNMSNTALDQSRGITLMSGSGYGYMVLSLPKGYRFTAYKINIKSDVQTSEVKNLIRKNFDTTSDIVFQEAEANGSTISSSSLKSVTLGAMGKEASANLSRTSMTDSDMGNKLYFRYGLSNGFAAFSIVSFEVSFESSVPFQVSVAPKTSTWRGFDCMLSEFDCGRIDVGEIDQQTKDVNGETKKFYGFHYSNVEDLLASMMLFDKDGINSATNKPDPTVFKDRKIFSNELSDGSYSYILKSGDYWIEAPTDVWATADNDSSEVGTDLPIGYRITGAKIYYKHEAHYTRAAGFYIMNDSSQYLNPNTSSTAADAAPVWGDTKVVWHLEKASSTSDDAYIYCEIENIKYYLGVKETTTGYWFYTYTSYVATCSSNTKYRTYMRKRADGDIALGSAYGNRARYLQNDLDFTTSKTDAVSVYNAGRLESTNTAATDYELVLYDKDGKKVAAAVDVTSDTPSGYIEVTGLNNDAVKFTVQAKDGAAPSADLEAQLTMELTLEALNPYVQKMDVVCKGTKDGTEHTLTQQYVTTDFQIGSGTTSFYVPTNFAGTSLTFSFDNVQNSHHDNTYFDDTTSKENSRYYFVKSPYYNIVNEDLHGKASTVADHTYTDKVNTTVVGDKAFLFNNSDSLLSTQLGKEGAYFHEYLFSMDKYTSKTGTGGTFSVLKMNTNNTTEEPSEKTFYLFVADETRYNISPATGMRHLYYSFYKGTLKLEAQEYTPSFTYEKLYDETLKKDGTIDNNAYYGVKLGLSNSSSTDFQEGYLTVKQITKQLADDIANTNVTTPVDTKHILYIDATNLYTVLHDGTSTATAADGMGNFNTLRGSLADNALIYLPHVTTTTYNNFARKMIGGAFTACNDIVLTDQQPFYAPSDISLDADKKVIYSRKFTANNGRAKYATLMLPFAMAVSNDGIYSKGSYVLQFYDIPSSGFLSNVKPITTEGDNYYGNANFTKLSGATTTEANHPYFVEVTAYDENESDVSFTIVQGGTTLKATPTVDNGKETAGTTTSTTINGANVTFTHKATYAGEQKVKDSNTFYFATNKLFSSRNLADGKYVKLRPFRSYFAYDGEASNALLLSYLNIGFNPEENTSNIMLPGPNANNGLLVTTHKGCISVKANDDAIVSIVNMAGWSICGDRNVSAGESFTVAAAPGVYVVNKFKVIVK